MLNTMKTKCFNVDTYERKRKYYPLTSKQRAAANQRMRIKRQTEKEERLKAIRATLDHLLQNYNLIYVEPKKPI